MFLDSQFKTSERLIMTYVTRKSVPGFGGIVLKRCLKFSNLGKRQANKVFVPGVVVMDLLRGVEVI